MTTSPDPQSCKHSLLYQCIDCGTLQCTRCDGQFSQTPRVIAVAACVWRCARCVNKPEPRFVLKDAISERMTNTAEAMDAGLRSLRIDPNTIKTPGIRDNT